ncbi:hypothetical protein AAG906_010886 [Vitis piasezkii]
MQTDGLSEAPLITGGTRGIGCPSLTFHFAFTFLRFLFHDFGLLGTFSIYFLLIELKPISLHDDVFSLFLCRYAVVEELAGLVIASVCDGRDRAQREKLMEKIFSIFNGKLNILSLYGDGKNKRQSFGGGTQAAFGTWAWE